MIPSRGITEQNGCSCLILICDIAFQDFNRLSEYTSKLVNFYELERAILMLPPHIAECTRLDSTTNDSPNSTHRGHTARLSFEWEEVKMEDMQVAAAAYYFISAYDWAARDV
jgi:hypothetical protein